VGDDLVHAAHGDPLPVLDHQDAGAQLLHQAEQVGTQDHRAPPRAALARIVRFMRRIAPGSRPVSGSSSSRARGRVQQAARDGELLLHAA
jgi:hypothetical protein